MKQEHFLRETLGGELYIDKIIIHGKNVFEGEDGTVYYYDAYPR